MEFKKTREFVRRIEKFPVIQRITSPTENLK
jgi:hypothetical protein